MLVGTDIAVKLLVIRSTNMFAPLCSPRLTRVLSETDELT